MANSLPSYLMEDPKKSYKPKVKGMSFLAFIFSIFIYIYIFYIFNLSPSTLSFNNTKFWFLISNTLILIIAADYGTFCATSRDKQGVYDEYFMHSDARRRTSSFVMEYQEIDKKTDVNTRKQDTPVENMQERKEKKSETLENNLQIVAITEQEKPSIITQQDQDQDHDIQEKRIVHVDKRDNICETNNNNERRSNSTTYRRSKSESEKVKRVVIDESENSVVLRRSETKKQYGQENEGEVINEFSNMSDDDLNRRVEEFIQRFNRQIRLQARNYDD